MRVRITGRRVTPEELARLLGISPDREQAIAELTGYKANGAKSHAYKTKSRGRTHKVSAKKAAKRR